MVQFFFSLVNYPFKNDGMTTGSSLFLLLHRLSLSLSIKANLSDVTQTDRRLHSSCVCLCVSTGPVMMSRWWCALMTGDSQSAQDICSVDIRCCHRHSKCQFPRPCPCPSRRETQSCPQDSSGIRHHLSKFPNQVSALS